MGPWASRYVFEPRSLLAAIDPVAKDRGAMNLIDARRAQAGLPRLGRLDPIAHTRPALG